MGHEITQYDNVVLRKERAWHGLGTVIEDDITAVDACDEYGLGWDVVSWPVYMRDPETGSYHEIGGQRANVRKIVTPEGDIPTSLGIVTKSYEIYQNRDLAEFVDALSSTGNVVLETAGTIRGGRRVWFLVRSDSYQIGDDKSYSYLLASNAHDGSGSLRLDPTDIRVVCANTLRMVVPDQVDGRMDLVPAAITVRHSSSLQDRLEQARLALRDFATIKQRHRELVERLAEKRINRRQAVEFFAEQYVGEFLVPEEAETAKIQERREHRRSKAAAAFLSRYDAECAKFGGESAWLALNAWTGYVQHDLTSRGKEDKSRVDNRINSTLFGVNAKRSSSAVVDAVAMFLAT